MKLTDIEKDILSRLIENELEYYERKEDMYKEDVEYVKILMKILKKVGE